MCIYELELVGDCNDPVDPPVTSHQPPAGQINTITGVRGDKEEAMFKFLFFFFCLSGEYLLKLIFIIHQHLF